MTHYIVDSEINYIAAFLTFGCQLDCSYCINKAGLNLVPRRQLKPDQWVKGLSRFWIRPDLPITLQGGEPTTYAGFYEVVRNLPERIPLDLLTNVQFPVDKFIREVSPSKFGRIANYAPIRISYHRETMLPMDTIHRALTLQKAGFKVGLFAVDIPKNREHNEWFARQCAANSLDFRWKEYLAPGFGTYRYPDSVFQTSTKSVMCSTTEILIDPAGNIFRCHSDLYSNLNILGNILDNELFDFTAKRSCVRYGHCSSCDTKIKNDRFQRFGHSSVEVTFNG